MVDFFKNINLYCFDTRMNWKWANIMVQEHGINSVSVYANQFETARRHFTKDVDVSPYIDFPFGCSSTAEKLFSLKWFTENGAKGVTVPMSQNYIETQNQRAISLECERILSESKSGSDVWFHIPVFASILKNKACARVVERVVKNTGIRKLSMNVFDDHLPENILFYRKIRSCFDGQIRVLLSKNETHNFMNYKKAGIDSISVHWQYGINFLRTNQASYQQND